MTRYRIWVRDTNSEFLHIDFPHNQTNYSWVVAVCKAWRFSRHFSQVLIERVEAQR